MNRTPWRPRRSRFGVWMCGEPYEERSAQPRSSPRMKRMLGRRECLSRAARKGRSRAASAGATAAAENGVAAEAGVATAGIPAAAVAAVAPTAVPKARRVSGIETVPLFELLESREGMTAPGQGSAAHGGAVEGKPGGTRQASHADMRTRTRVRVRESGSGGHRRGGGPVTVSRRASTGARSGNQAQRQMALATRPRSTWRRSTSVTERSPRGCMGQEPAKGACACQRRSRTPDAGRCTAGRRDPESGGGV